MDQALTNEAGYDADFYAWTQRQSELLRAGRLSELDVENLAEEIESLGRSETKEVGSRLAVILTHLVKWQFQPAFRSQSWMSSIKTQRIDLRRHLDENPSLRARLSSFVDVAYDKGRREASVQTGFRESAFPADCPYTLDQIMSDTFVPSGGVNEKDDFLPDDTASAPAKD